MANTDCPFKAAKEVIRKVKNETNIIIIDFHAENVEEKEALALFLDGQITSLTGTHTHVQTGDERILERGTAFMSDLGMTGPAPGVIGSDKETAIRRQQTQMPLKMAIEDLPAIINGAVITIDKKNGKALSIKRISEKTL
jgi:calcineurin-like phosphoesterase